MSRLTRAAFAAGGAAVVAAALALPTTAADAASTPTYGTVHACSQSVAKGYAACFAQVRTVNGSAQATPSVAKAGGYGPADLRSAYNLNGTSSGGKTIAIVDAYDNPKAESDLAAYRSQYGLPACTTANGCFRKVNQSGGTSYPAGNTGWGLEIALDLDMASASCPDCKILLVEANSPSFANLGAAVNYAATQNVAAISNSYGGSDSSQQSAYNHPGIAVTASTGDDGYGVSSPASYNTVVAVGGTTLKRAASTARGWKETAWSGAGSGCSTLNSRPSWQPQATTKCSGRALADVSAVADPNTGVAVYDTYGYGGFVVVGGTSASAPFVAGVYALGGNLSGYPASYTWAHASSLYDVKGGSNGTCTPSKWCHGVVGWDGPTGLGSPNGTAGF